MDNFREWLDRQVGYNRIFAETISHLPEYSQEFVMQWAPRTRIEEVPSPALSFLVGLVDLRFENLGISPEEKQALLRAFIGKGVRIPGTPYRLRYHGFMNFTLVEPAEGGEPELPADWRLFVWVLGYSQIGKKPEMLAWIGKKVPVDQIGEIDLSRYEDAGDGWRLKE